MCVRGCPSQPPNKKDKKKQQTNVVEYEQQMMWQAGRQASKMVLYQVDWTQINAQFGSKYIYIHIHMYCILLHTCQICGMLTKNHIPENRHAMEKYNSWRMSGDAENCFWLFYIYKWNIK